ncbi:sulfatase, partial [Planctomycetota bacterium]
MVNCQHIVAVLFIGMIFLGGCRATSPGPRGKKPYNVLFIAVDDLNDWVGSLGGHPHASTPHIDRLAERGILFEQAYCPAPLCNPSRTAILMGLSPSTTGIYENRTWFRDLPEYEDWVTLPQYFQKHGYQTLAGGKIFHHPQGKMSDPNSWEKVYQTEVGTPYPAPLEQHKNGLRGKFGDATISTALDWAGLDVNDEACADWQTADRAAQYLQQDHERPFFLACGIFRPHLRWYAPQPYFDLHPIDEVVLPPYIENDLDDVPKAGKQMAGWYFSAIKEHGQWRPGVQAYLACSSFADACVGQVLDALENSPHKDNTIVVLWGDHGWHLGEKDHWAKLALWEPASRTPFIIYVPGNKKGKRCSHPVNLLDMHATLIELCDLPPRDDIEGRSLAPLVKKPTKKWPYPAVMTHGYQNHAVRNPQYRYIRYADGSDELYDLQADPNEWTNLANKRAYIKVKREL